MTWRDQCRPIIARVIAENAGRKPAEVRKALRAAYVFGPRKYHPYKIWCDEVRLQLGLRPDRRPHKGFKRPVPKCEGQKGLFDE